MPAACGRRHFWGHHMTQSLIQEPVQSYEDSNGKPLNGGQLFTYSAGTLTLKATYQDAAGATPNTNPIVLNERGEAVVYGSGNYRMILKNAAGATIWDRDNVSTAPTLDDLSGSDGASFIGYDDATLDVFLKDRLNRVVDTIAALRGLDKTKYTRAFVTGYYGAGDGGGGAYWYDSGDTTSADNGGSVIVATDSARWKLSETDRFSVKQFGAKGDNVQDDGPFIQKAADASSNSKQIWFPQGTYKVDTVVLASSTINYAFDGGVSITGSQAGSITNNNQNTDYLERNFSATGGSVMRVQRAYQQKVDLATLAYLWPNPTFTYFGVAKRFDSGDTAAPNGSPYSAFTSYALDNASGADVCSLLGVSVAAQNNGIAFGANLIAANQSGNTNSKLVGLEIDVEPTSGTTVNSGSAAAYINAFNINGVGPVMQVGGVSGGKFSNGILMNAIASTGAAFAAQSGLSCSVGLDLSQGTYGNAAIQLGTNQPLKFTSSSGSQIFGDGSNGLHVQLAGQSYFDANTTTEGTVIANFRNSTPQAAVQITVANNISWNGSAAAMFVAQNSSTSRSINAAGTLNASGADYAEYEYKRDDCGAVEKGQIIGFDADGLITDKFSLAISFGIKSTEPNLVGGDTWDKAVGPRPDSPIAPVEPIMLSVDAAGSSRASQYADAIAAEQKEVDAKNLDAQRAYEADLAKYQSDLAAYQTALADWEAGIEAARQRVDRIAYCGKVPVNVLGAVPGQYLIPIAQVDDSIGHSLVDADNVSFAQYRLAVGQVRRVLADGRAEVVVKPI